MSTVSSFEGEQRKPKGAVLFTGPEGIGDYKVTVIEQHYIGNGFTSPESSSDTNYICRAANDTPHHPPKSKVVGEIGWGLPQNTDYTLLKSGHQIMLKDFRQAVEDRHTHLYQAPYYPPPDERKDNKHTTCDITQQTTAASELEPTQSKSSVSQSSEMN